MPPPPIGEVGDEAEPLPPLADYPLELMPRPRRRRRLPPLDVLLTPEEDLADGALEPPSGAPEAMRAVGGWGSASTMVSSSNSNSKRISTKEGGACWRLRKKRRMLWKHSGRPRRMFMART